MVEDLSDYRHRDFPRRTGGNWQAYGRAQPSEQPRSQAGGEKPFSTFLKPPARAQDSYISR
nr:hypothetical protein [Paracoccus sp. S-4012]